MPKLTDDERYALELDAFRHMQASELMQFRRRLADRVTGMVAEAMEEMGPSYDEKILRQALAGYDQVYVEESMRFIERMLVRSGELEVAKRIAEVAAHVEIEDLPEAFQAAHKELSGTGLMQPYIDRKLTRAQAIMEVGTAEEVW